MPTTYNHKVVSYKVYPLLMSISPECKCCPELIAAGAVIYYNKEFSQLDFKCNFLTLKTKTNIFLTFMMNVLSAAARSQTCLHVQMWPVETLLACFVPFVLIRWSVSRPAVATSAEIKQNAPGRHDIINKTPTWAPAGVLDRFVHYINIYCV